MRNELDERRWRLPVRSAKLEKIANAEERCIHGSLNYDNTEKFHSLYPSVTITYVETMCNTIVIHREFHKYRFSMFLYTLNSTTTLTTSLFINLFRILCNVLCVYVYMYRGTS